MTPSPLEPEDIVNVRAKAIDLAIAAHPVAPDEAADQARADLIVETARKFAGFILEPNDA